MEKLGAPFHAVFTAEQVGSYKPRMNGFEYMLDTLGCGPEDITHVSSSFRYDLMTAYDLGIKSKVWVNRGHEPANPYYEYTEIKDISGLPGVFGLCEVKSCPTGATAPRPSPRLRRGRSRAAMMSR